MGTRCSPTSYHTFLIEHNSQPKSASKPEEMSLVERATETLKTSLFKQNKPANYKVLSRSLDIPATDAKKLLYTFYNAHKDQLQATFVIIGQPRDSVKQTVVKVTNDLEDKSQFEKVESVQVYSLSAKEISADEVAQMIVAEAAEIEVTEERIAKWRLIKGPDFVKVEKAEVATNTASTRPSNSFVSGAKDDEKKKKNTQGDVFLSMNKTGAKDEEEKKTVFPDMTSQASRILAKYKKEEPKKRDTQQTFGRSVASGPTAKGKESSPVSVRDPASGVETLNDPPLNNVDNFKKQRGEMQEKSRRQKELEAMFDDDDDEDVDVIEIEGSVKEEEELGVKTEESESKHADLEGIFDSSFSQSQSQPQSQSENPQERTKKSPKTTEKAKTTTFVDEEGFIVTKVDKSKTDSKPAKSKPRPAVNSTTAPTTKKQKTGVKQQSSLASFFGRKK